MLGFLYLALIVGWMLIVIMLKCKKVLTPYLVYASDLREAERHPTVHVIQLNDAVGCPSGRHSVVSDEVESYPAEVLTNHGYENDEHITVNGSEALSAPPPSYEEVMRQPAIYPKLQDLKNI